MKGLVDLGVSFQEVYDCSDDGRIVVGSAIGSEGWREPTLYIDGEGKYELFDWLSLHGISVSSHVGGAITSMATNGNSIFLTGLSTGQSAMRIEAFVATVPEASTSMGVVLGLGLLAFWRRKPRN
ncbi:MAG TPA: PEP-CTERM sorting domain-containing protein [Fimbriimonadaceae bacterium]|nr:PEP-CTERM sorting domain-containing protein [Fimbriimonadaceae bacterium]